MSPPPNKNIHLGFLLILPLVLIFLSLACGLPGNSQPTVQATFQSNQVESQENEARPEPTQPPPTPTHQPLPPVLVEVDPPLGSDFPLQGPLTLYFNQPMDKPSVEIALSGRPALSGRFSWIDTATVAFKPDAPYPPGTDLDINISTSALAINGLFLPEPVDLHYRTISPLTALQVLPESGLVDADPTSVVVVTFNHPVVPVGADSATLPAAFSINPLVPGDGEWVNPSTYIYSPHTALAGGIEYTVLLNPDLTTTAGGPFSGRASYEFRPYEWTFRTAAPRLVSIEPNNGTESVRLDSIIKIEFSQPMDADNVEDNFNLYDLKQQAVPGQVVWDDDFLTLTFTPTQLLDRGTYYDIILLGTAQSLGGTSLGMDHVSRIQTVPDLRIATTEPVISGSKSQYSNVVLHFNGPAEVKNPFDYITFSSKVPNLTHWWDELGRSLYIRGDFEPISAYTTTVSGAYPDPWGGNLGEDFVFKFSTDPLEPNFFVSSGETAIFTTPGDAYITAQATHIEKIGIRIGSVPFDDMVDFQAPGGYEAFSQYQPADQQIWTYSAGLPGDRTNRVSIPITHKDTGLQPGIYHLEFFIPELSQQPPTYLLVSSNVHLSFKLSTTSAFVWAVDVRTNQPVQGVPVAIFDSFGNRLSSGVTDALGVFQTPISTQSDLYGTYFAILSEPGKEFFSLSLSNWSQGIEPYDFGFDTDFTAPALITYLYTDRPIYQPGQTVYYRGVVRHQHNGRYALPDVDILPVTVYDDSYTPVLSLDLPVSEFGTIQAEYILPANAQPGSYQISTDSGSVSFLVAEYRAPEIDLEVDSAKTALARDTLSAQVNARYFFGAPAGKVPLTWSLYRQAANFNLPGYQVGTNDFRWLDPPWRMYTSLFGEFITAGTSITNPEGSQTINFPADPELDNLSIYTLEVTLTDESGFPVSARSEITVHPSDFYIGVRPDSWVGQSGTEITFDIKVVDWDKNTAGERDLTAQFQKVTWEREDSPDPFNYPTFTPRYSPVASTDFHTAPDGIARLAFTPPEAGTYQLDVSGGGARTQALVWVGGSTGVVWPNLPNNRLQITADKLAYIPGDIATIFIPNPFGTGAQALITIERDEILRHDVLVLDSAGYNYQLPLSNLDAPNIYVSVTLIGKDNQDRPDFRQGYLNLNVEPLSLSLKTTISLEPAKVGPREETTLTLFVRNSNGNPVQGEFSVAVVDQAVLALTDPNAEDILSAFYSQQPLGIRTGMSLVVYAHRQTNIPVGIGGGGEKGVDLMVREDFPGTAYWNASVLTDANGEAQITLPLPDNLTTWQVDVRGLTADTRVGEATQDLLVTKDLLIRPAIPRFLVVGDHTQLTAVVHNNSADELQVDVSLEGAGFTLDDPHSAAQTHTISAGGRLRVSWWGRVEDLDSLDLVFSARGGGFQDAARPPQGEIPVLRFTVPQTFGTAGILDLEEEHLEIISLPRTFDPTGGTLQVEASPSLAAALTAGLDALEELSYPCTEQTLSRFLPNLMAYRAIQDLGLESPDLLARLERTLDAGIQDLASLQNPDGGWGWWSAASSDPSISGQAAPASDTYLSAYVIFGLSKAREAGAFVDEGVLKMGTDYLLATKPVLEMLSSSWQLDRLALHYYALSQAGAGTIGAPRNLFEVRDQLSPYARALLSLTLAAYEPEDERIDTLLSDLDGAAIRTATGIHWEGAGLKTNLDTPMFNTAMVVYALAQQDPAAFMLPEAVRYLMSHRKADGSWGSTYETAWTLMALTQVMKGTGELAGDFGFSAVLNGSPLLDGQAGGETRTTPVRAAVPVSNLYPTYPNGLSIRRTSGPGRLYYSAHLNVVRPAADVDPLSQGISVSRSTIPQANTPLAVGSMPTVKVTLTLENEAYYLVVEDYLPAGAEILDNSLKTSLLGAASLDVSRPFEHGWGWWYFNDPLVYNDHITWAADYLPAGTYELTYTLVLTHPGEYQVLPARAWEFYFPEVQGHSAGDLFKIEE